MVSVLLLSLPSNVHQSYTLRNGILGMMGEILTKYICKEEIDDKLRATRDGFFEKLEVCFLMQLCFVMDFRGNCFHLARIFFNR